MRFKNLMFLTVLALFVLAACGEKKKEAVEKEAIMKAAKEELETEVDALAKTEDSLRQVWADSIRRDSITKDSLRQVKEHGHAH